MAIAVKSSGVSSPFSVRSIEVTELPNTGLSDFVSSSATVYTLDMDNSANGAVTYFRLYDDASPTYGTTEPSVIVKVAANARQVWTVSSGLSLGSGFSVAASTVGGHAIGASPSSSFNFSAVLS